MRFRLGMQRFRTHTKDALANALAKEVAAHLMAAMVPTFAPLREDDRGTTCRDGISLGESLSRVLQFAPVADLPAAQSARDAWASPFAPKRAPAHQAQSSSDVSAQPISVSPLRAALWPTVGESLCKSVRPMRTPSVFVGGRGGTVLMQSLEELRFGRTMCA